MEKGSEVTKTAEEKARERFPQAPDEPDFDALMLQTGYEAALTEEVQPLERENAELRESVQVLVDALAKLKRKHLEVEDGFYSCVKADNYFGPDETSECDCGADDANARIDAALSLANSRHQITPTP